MATYLNPNAIEDKSINFDKLNITPQDLGLSAALKYCGTTTTALTDGATTNPIVIGGTNHTATSGCVVFYGDKEFIYNGTSWEEFGYPTDLSGKQDKLTSGTTIKTVNNTSILGSGNIDATTVKMSLSSSNASYPILTATASSPSNGSANSTLYNTGVSINHSTKTLKATSIETETANFKGAITIGDNTNRTHTVNGSMDITTNDTTGFNVKTSSNESSIGFNNTEMNITSPSIIITGEVGIEGTITADEFSGNATSATTSSTATTLQTARTINGMSFNGSKDIVFYGYCTTDGATAAKVITNNNYTYISQTGLNIIVKFSNALDVDDPTLNINSTGAYPIRWRGFKVKKGFWSANSTLHLCFDGGNYNIVDGSPSNIVTYTSSTTSASVMGGITYKWTSVGSTLNITFYDSNPAVSTISPINIVLVIGTTVPTLTVPGSVKWVNGTAPALEANTTVEISIFDSRATYAVFK